MSSFAIRRHFDWCAARICTRTTRQQTSNTGSKQNKIKTEGGTGIWCTLYGAPNTALSDESVQCIQHHIVRWRHEYCTHLPLRLLRPYRVLWASRVLREGRSLASSGWVARGFQYRNQRTSFEPFNCRNRRQPRQLHNDGK